MANKRSTMYLPNIGEVPCTIVDGESLIAVEDIEEITGLTRSELAERWAELHGCTPAEVRQLLGFIGEDPPRKTRFPGVPEEVRKGMSDREVDRTIIEMNLTPSEEARIRQRMKTRQSSTAK